MKGRMMRRLVVLCVVMLVTAHWAAFCAIVLGANGDAVNKWLIQTDIPFCTELLMTLVKKLLDDKKSGRELKGE